MAVQLKKSMVIEELSKGGSIKVIAERLGITTSMLRKAATTFGLNLRKKPKMEVMELIDDSDEVTFTQPITPKNTFVEEDLEESPVTTTMLM